MKTIAFDLDGTLVDVSERDYRIYYDILQQLGYKPIPKEKYWPLRQDVTDIHKILALSNLVSQKDVDTFLGRRKALMEEWKYLIVDKLFDDAIETLSTLKKKFNLLILTKRYNTEETEKQISELGLRQYADVKIVTGSKEDAMKEVYDLYAMIGDTENDIIPANMNGVKSVAVTTGIRNAEKLRTYNPTMIVNSLNEVIQYL